MASSPFRALLFDMDGVLVDVSNSYRRTISETVYFFTGREITGEQIQQYKDRGGFNDDWKLTYTLIREAGMEVSYSRMHDEFQRRYRGENWNGLIQQEASLVTPQTLAQLQPGRVFGIVTGRPEAEAKWTLEYLGLKKHFPLLVAMEQQDRRTKPDPYPLRRSLAMLKQCGMTVEPEEAVYVGDTGDDMLAARAAGFWAIGHVPPQADPERHEGILRDRGAHLVIRGLSELPGALSELEHMAKEKQQEVYA